MWTHSWNQCHGSSWQRTEAGKSTENVGKLRYTLPAINKQASRRTDACNGSSSNVGAVPALKKEKKGKKNPLCSDIYKYIHLGEGNQLGE